MEWPVTDMSSGTNAITAIPSGMVLKRAIATASTPTRDVVDGMVDGMADGTTDRGGIEETTSSSPIAGSKATKVTVDVSKVL